MHNSDKIEVGKKKMNLAETFMYLEYVEVSGNSDSKSDI